MNRFEHYFQLIMNNPDKYIRVNLIKPGHKKHRKERRELFDRITHTLKLMGIDYQIAENTTYKIRVVSREKR